MPIIQTQATVVVCEHPDPKDPCASRVRGAADLTDDEARRAAAERGWDGGRLLCPKHR